MLLLQIDLGAGEEVGKAELTGDTLLVDDNLAVGPQNGLLIGQILGAVVAGFDVVKGLLNGVGPRTFEGGNQVVNSLDRVEIAVRTLV